MSQRVQPGAEPAREGEARLATARQPTFDAPLQACPVCGGAASEIRPLFSKEGATFVRCASCAFEFVNPRPSAEWLSARYAAYGEGYFTVPAKLESDFAEGRYREELALLHASVPPGGELLDVGAATGSFVKAARHAGFSARGIELSEESVRYGRDVLGLPLEAGDLFARAYPDDSFDAVTLWATLEHLPDPGAFLREFRRILKPGGTLALSVPNHAGIGQRILGRRNRYVGIDHVNYFSAGTLRRLLTRHGFVLTRVLTDRVNPIVIWQDLRGAGRNGASSEQLLSDQAATNAVKRGGGGVARVARVAHRAVCSVLRATGMGELLYAVAQKRV
jgi:ubiquinone/menaquinone biosynthesis C-methylase UbiE